MQSVRCRGRLIRWNDDRGFGFIQPEEGGHQVFLHISALPSAVRRPQVGDIVTYEPAAQAEGKVRAVNAVIAGVAARPAERSAARKQGRLPEILVGVAVVAAVAFCVPRLGDIRVSPSTSAPQEDTAPQWDTAPPPGYPIKGNISVGTRARIYHVPGSQDYEITKIDPSRGERWFRSEAEATASGWRRAPR